MKIENALVTAADHFIQRVDNGNKTRQILEQYAAEELSLTVILAQKFAVEATAGQAAEW